MDNPAVGDSSTWGRYRQAQAGDALHPFRMFSPAPASTICPRFWTEDLLPSTMEGYMMLPLTNNPRTHRFSEGTMTGTHAPANCAFFPESCYSECPEENNKAALYPRQ